MKSFTFHRPLVFEGWGLVLEAEATERKAILKNLEMPILQKLFGPATETRIPATVDHYQLT